MKCNAPGRKVLLRQRSRVHGAGSTGLRGGVEGVELEDGGVKRISGDDEKHLIRGVFGGAGNRAMERRSGMEIDSLAGRKSLRFGIQKRSRDAVVAAEGEQRDRERNVVLIGDTSGVERTIVLARGNIAVS